MPEDTDVAARPTVDERPTRVTAARRRAPMVGAARRRSSRVPLLIGIILGVLVAGWGVALAAVQPPTWSTHREVVVVPRPDIEVNGAAALYESLSRGQVVATAAEIYGQVRWHPNTPGVTVTAGAVAPSSVIRITSSGTDRAAVVRALDEVVGAGTKGVNTTVSPYRAVVLSAVTPAPVATGPSRVLLVGVALLAGVLVGVLATGFSRLLARRRVE